MLAGFPPAQRFRVADALEAELARLIARGGADRFPAVGRDVAEVDAGRVTVADPKRSDRIGAQIAGAVYRGLVK